MRSEPSPTRSRTRGQRTAIGPMPVTISRSGRCPWRTSRRRPSSVSWSAWWLSKAATSASTACESSARAPLRKTSVSGSDNVPGWESWKTLLLVTAYHSFGGEVGGFEHPHDTPPYPLCRHQLSQIAHSTFGYEQVFSALEYRSDAASAAEGAGLRAERPCVAVYCCTGGGGPRSQGDSR